MALGAALVLAGTGTTQLPPANWTVSDDGETEIHNNCSGTSDVLVQVTLAADSQDNQVVLAVKQCSNGAYTDCVTVTPENPGSISVPPGSKAVVVDLPIDDPGPPCDFGPNDPGSAPAKGTKVAS